MTVPLPFNPKKETALEGLGPIPFDLVAGEDPERTFARSLDALRRRGVSPEDRERFAADVSSELPGTPPNRIRLLAVLDRWFNMRTETDR